MTVLNSAITEIEGDLRDGVAVRLTTTRRRRPVRARMRKDQAEVLTWTCALPLRLFRAVRSFHSFRTQAERS